MQSPPTALSSACSVGVVPVPVTAACISFRAVPLLQLRTGRLAPIRSSNNAQPSVDYSSPVSVFPAEACETIGGDACLADMYPEAKLKEEQKLSASASSKGKEEAVEREYLDYADPKTVLLDEACDVLGGEFCEPPYQQQQKQT